MRNLSKNIKMTLAVIGGTFLVYNIILFVIAGFTGHSSTFWISYTFMVAALVAATTISLLNFKKGFTLKDWFFGYPILRWSYTYIAVELVVSIIFMLTPGSFLKAAFVVQFLMICVYFAIVASCFVAKKVAMSEEKVDEKVFYIRNMNVVLQTIFNETGETTLKSGVQKLMEAVRYSDPMSHESLTAIEQDIERNIYLLRDYVIENDAKEALESIRHIDNLLKERNASCKISKKLK